MQFYFILLDHFLYNLAFFIPVISVINMHMNQVDQFIFFPTFVNLHRRKMSSSLVVLRIIKLNVQF